MGFDRQDTKRWGAELARGQEGGIERKRFYSSKLRLREAELREHPCGSEPTVVSQALRRIPSAQYLGTWPQWDARDERMEEWNVGASETPS